MMKPMLSIVAATTLAAVSSDGLDAGREAATPVPVPNASDTVAATQASANTPERAVGGDHDEPGDDQHRPGDVGPDHHSSLVEAVGERRQHGREHRLDGVANRCEDGDGSGAATASNTHTAMAVETPSPRSPNRRRRG